jgi:hypothetical protein
MLNWMIDHQHLSLDIGNGSARLNWLMICQAKLLKPELFKKTQELEPFQTG